MRCRRPGAEDVWLVVSQKKGAWISSRVSERTETSEFTTRLRRELDRARFSRAYQADLDRVFLMEFQGAERRTLVLELMPPGNLLVLDQEGRILVALNEATSRGRRVARGSLYEPPANKRQSPGEVDPKSVGRMLEEEETLGRAIGRNVAIPRKYVADVLQAIDAVADTPSKEMTGRESEVSKALNEIVTRARDSPAPCLCETPDGDELFAYHPRGLLVKAEAGSMSELCDSEFLEEATSPTIEESPEEAKAKELKATVSKLRKEASSLAAGALKARESAEEARRSPLEAGLKLMRDSGVRPQREPGSSQGVASLLYDHAKELEAKASMGLEAAEKLEKRASKVPKGTPPRKREISRRRGEWFEKYRWFKTTQGRLAIGGRDAQSNSAILSKHREAMDVVYHADLFGSPFFVLKGGGAQTEDEIREVAQATVAFSSAWKTGLGSADAYWVAPDQVSSSAPSGEYLAKGSFAIRGKKNFVPKLIVEVAVGVDRDGRVTAGPEAALRQSCDHYVVLRPHNEKGSETAKRVLQDLAGLGSAVPALDDVQRALPSGGGKVLRRV